MSDSSNALDITSILRCLPHRFPLVMVDRVTRIVAGQSIEARKCVAFNEPWFQGHFPQRPIMPGVLIVEALAQTCGILAQASEGMLGLKQAQNGEHRGGQVMAIASIDKVRLREFVQPGDVLELHARVLLHRENAWKFSAKACVDQKVRAECELLLVQVQSDEKPTDACCERA